MSKQQPSPPPQISPYIFPALLAGFGLWCAYDGWITTDPEMQKHLLFNRIGSIVLLSWAVLDFFRTRHLEKQDRERQNSAQPPAE